MKEDLEKAQKIIKETEENSLKLYGKLHSDVWDPDACCLDPETRSKVEEICRCLFQAYLLASEFLGEKGEMQK